MKAASILFTATALFGLSACDQFNSEFNKQFEAQYREQCAKVATEGGAPAELATKACNCTMDELKKGKSETEFNMPSQEEQMAAMEVCAKKMGMETVAPK
jgi:hypothetical protein